MNDEPSLAVAAMAIARAIHKLGVADASTPMGAIEAHGVVIEKAATTIAETLGGISSSLDDIASALDSIADALKSKADY